MATSSPRDLSSSSSIPTSSQHDPSSSSSITTSAQHDQENIIIPARTDKDPKYYIPLYKAALEGNWKTAKEFLVSDSDAIVARITPTLQTALHVAAMSGHTSFVEELVQLTPVDALALKDTDGFTILHSIAEAGDLKGAKAMVRKNPDLPQMREISGDTPILRAARLGHKDLLWYLCSVTRDEDPSPFRGHDGVHLLKIVIAADLYDVALHLVQLYPELATTRDRNNESALYVLARRSSAFKSGTGLGFLQHCIYLCVRVEQASSTNHHRRRTMEKPLKSSRASHMTQIIQVLQRLNVLFGKAARQLVPGIKQVYDTKLMHTHALELVKGICVQVSRLDNRSEMDKLLGFSTLLAAEYGNVEVLTSCIETDPHQIWNAYGRTDHNILHIAIKHRQEKVFNLIRGIGPIYNALAVIRDKEGNNVLHQAAKLGPPSKLNVASGAALQMQRELQWYQEVEKIVQPAFRVMENYNRKKPRLLFSEEHKDLIEKGDQWMKDMASSSMVVATLIATVVFTAAFTVPGGNNSNTGTPIFLKDKLFILFATSNALALFSSLTSVLIFLSILTSRYAEEDFLKSLPQKLIIGLAMLFFSIVSMMITFSTTYFIMLGHRYGWVALLLALLACVPVTLFALLQLPLFVEVIRSTYGSDVFRLQKLKWC